jgi:hypothetical protein
MIKCDITIKQTFKITAPKTLIINESKIKKCFKKPSLGGCCADIVSCHYGLFYCVDEHRRYKTGLCNFKNVPTQLGEMSQMFEAP